MSQDVSLWIKPVIYLVAVAALGLRAQHLARRYGALLPPEERRGALFYDPEVHVQIQRNPLFFFTGSTMTRAAEVARRRQDDPLLERRRREAGRWAWAAVLVAIFGLPLL